MAKTALNFVFSVYVVWWHILKITFSTTNMD